MNVVEFIPRISAETMFSNILCNEYIVEFDEHIVEFDALDVPVIAESLQ